MRTIAVFFLSTLMLLGMASATAQTPTTLNYASTKDIRDINPHPYSGEMAAQNMVFESLVGFVE